MRELGTRAHVTEVLERFDDGRLNILVDGGDRFRVEQLTQGRSFLTALVEPVADGAGQVDPETAGKAAGSFRALATLAAAKTEEIDEGSPQLSFELAAQVELDSEAKQQLLELQSEQSRLELLVELLDSVRIALIATRELGHRAKTHGSRLYPRPREVLRPSFRSMFVLRRARGGGAAHALCFAADVKPRVSLQSRARWSLSQCPQARGVPGLPRNAPRWLRPWVIGAGRRLEPAARRPPRAGG